jgi:tRNA threonylcarbamoyladenosine biosynthesis protein TsaE
MSISQEPINPTPILDFVSHSTGQTQRLGAKLGSLASPGDVFALEGPLGSGKTLLAHGIAEGLGVKDDITSPSFTLINEYRPRDSGGRLPFYHIDLYRLGEAAKEAIAMGMEDYIYGRGVCVIEWADRALDILPPEHLLIRLSIVSEYKRGFYMLPRGARYANLLREFKRIAFGM